MRAEDHRSSQMQKLTSILRTQWYHPRVIRTISLIVILLAWVGLAFAGHGGRSSGYSHSRSSSYHPSRSSYSSHSQSSSTHRSSPSYHSHRGSSSYRSYTASRDSHGRIQRSERAKNDFKRMSPCPSTGKRSGACPGYVVDHVNPLECGGADAPSNMQWQTVSAAKAKDRTEARCRK